MEMEAAYMPSNGERGMGDGVNDGEKQVVAVANKRAMSFSYLVLRFLALALTLAAAVLLGVNKQSTVVPVVMVPTLPPLSVDVTAKWHYLSAFVYFVVANAIACAYAAISLLLTMANRAGKKGLGMIITIFDLVMVALLFSSVGAAFAVGLIRFQGNSHVQWRKVCNVFDKFCDQAAVAVGISFVGSMSFFLMVLLATLNLHKKYQ
ncbi:CASP 1E2 [Olea europaea subsp. europaea]|uniref:CASP-like protein n=1 Tax=Olea europaea subsp. europaea TaxID=158383 RepID=A0A8S0VAN0_OLEEU|nr:CASP 1E2 [Olea europaea subsp. europaea]